MLLFSFAQLSGENYFEGKLNIKVQTPFTSITLKSGIIQTEKSWFNQLSEQYQIYYLKKVFRSNQRNFPLSLCYRISI